MIQQILLLYEIRRDTENLNGCYQGTQGFQILPPNLISKNCSLRDMTFFMIVSKIFKKKQKNSNLHLVVGICEVANLASRNDCQIFVFVEI